LKCKLKINYFLHNVYIEFTLQGYIGITVKENNLLFILQGEICVSYTILFTNYEIRGENERLIEEYKLSLSESKAGTEELLKKLNYHFIGNDDVWGFRSGYFMSIAEIIPLTLRE